ncbi:metal-dependent hydrolase [Halovenus sp. WSH3]|uniref:Metal-dependent hydrolase n=1 Tax=Halovenus carboxidivorans TaxID=2692199 RepID=A0A6B0T333_9EURY|nr:metal-dependent hydrolase [Halovenus carboxidivorans]MXR51527.1 metal-dependent hydrolase [Halovenus carboxidivorans]
MQGLGHVGAALLVYLPLGAGLRLAGEPEAAAGGLLVAIALSSLPDIDQSLPVPHRGPTHTVWFVSACGLLAGALGWLWSGPTAGLVAGTAAGLSLCSHLAADSITPMGIRPLLPLSSREFCFSIVYAANERANRLLFGAGALATVCSYLPVVV